MHLVYDVSHNIAKVSDVFQPLSNCKFGRTRLFLSKSTALYRLQLLGLQVEDHLIKGEMKRLLVHRKGSTRYRDKLLASPIPPACTSPLPGCAMYCPQDMQFLTQHSIQNTLSHSKINV